MLTACRFKSCHPHHNRYDPNQIFLAGDGFCFFYLEKFEDTHFRNERGCQQHIIDTATVHADRRMAFKFRGGTEINA